MGCSGQNGQDGLVHGFGHSRVRHLPHPLHLFASLTGSQHYHFGDFLDPQASLAAAMDRMVLTVAAHLPAGESVLDVGCGLGGTTRILSLRGHACTGIDPCCGSIEFARSMAPGNGAERYEVARFQQDRWPVRPQRGYRGALFLEVLQHMPSLDDLLRRSRELTGPGATLVFSDVFANSRLPWDAAPFHHRDALLDAASRRDHEVTHRTAIPDRVIATLERLLSALESRQDELIHLHQEIHPNIRDQIRELRHQCSVLKVALENEDVTYQIIVLRRP